MARSLKLALSALLTLGMLAGCTAKAEEIPETTIFPSETATPTETTAPPPTEAPDPTVLFLREMTLRQKVGQLFLVRPEDLYDNPSQEESGETNSIRVTELTEEMTAMLEAYPVGGIAMFSENITSPEQITAFNASLQAASAIPLFLAIDEEGGLVSRLARHTAFDLPRYKSVAAVGASENPEDAREMGSTIGAYLAEYGFNLDFAPVADVNTNPSNPVIGKRAFSGSGEVAAGMAAAMAEGLNSQGIIATFKHFPGHGDTAEDSHYGLAVTYRTGDQLASCELLPFLNADGNDFIMVGHIAVPEMTGNMIPASMSDYMVKQVLKGGLEFTGLVITDSLSMGAITQLYTPGEAAVTALLAGCDVLLLPENMEGAFEAVVTAVENGILTEEWLDETVLRILEFKQMHGILKY